MFENFDPNFYEEKGREQREVAGVCSENFGKRPRAEKLQAFEECLIPIFDILSRF